MQHAAPGSQPSTLSSQLSALNSPRHDPDLPQHAVAQEKHFTKRAWQRFGLRVTPARYRHWIRKVEEVADGTWILGAGACAGRTWWALTAGGLTLCVLYDEKTARLVTCLPYGNNPDRLLHKKKALRLKRRASKDSVDWRQKKRRKFREGVWS